MPTTVFRVPGKPGERHPSDLFVVGRVTRVEEGHSYTWPNGPDVEGAPSGKSEVPYNSDEAAVSTVYVHVSVDRADGRDSSVTAGQSLRLGITLIGKADLRPLHAELPGQRVAAILVSNARSVFQEDPDVLGVLGNGQFLGQISQDDLVTFPAWLHGSRDAGGAAASVRLSELLTPLEKPIEVDQMVNGRGSPAKAIPGRKVVDT